MDKIQALDAFWSSFGIDAIEEQSAYDEGVIDQLEISYPYITYEVAEDSFDAPVAISADLWDNATTWSRITQKCEEIYESISRGGKMIHYEGGAMWISRGSPFSQHMRTEETNDIRRIHININVEFLSM